MRSVRTIHNYDGHKIQQKIVNNNNLSFCFVTKAIKIIKHHQLVFK